MDEVKVARYSRVFDGYAGDAEYLTRDCFIRDTQRLAELRGHIPDSPASVALDQELGQFWDQLAAMADRDHDGRATREEWHAGAGAITARRPSPPACGKQRQPELAGFSRTGSDRSSA